MNAMHAINAVNAVNLIGKMNLIGEQEMADGTVRMELMGDCKITEGMAYRTPYVTWIVDKVDKAKEWEGFTTWYVYMRDPKSIFVRDEEEVQNGMPQM